MIQPKEFTYTNESKVCKLLSSILDLCKHLEVGIHDLIGVSNCMASLGTKRNYASNSGLLVL